MKRQLPDIITPVIQGSMGCFVACTAMVMGISYAEAYELIHPGRAKQKIWYTFGTGRGRIVVHSDSASDWDASLTPELAFNKLKRLGLKPRYADVRNIKKLKQTAIIWVRWEMQPDLMHSIVYDARTKLFWDPMKTVPLEPKGKRNLQRQLDSVIYLDSFTS